MIFPAQVARDNFYANSEIHVLNGGQIRLGDLRFDYLINSRQGNNSPFKSIILQVVAANLGILWRYNSYRIDPDSRDISPPVTVSGGVKIEL